VTSSPTIGSPATLTRQREAENFPVALRVLPGQLRADLIAVYNVVRVIDDAGDEASGNRLALLDDLETDLGRAFAPHPASDGVGPRLPVVAALVPTLRRHALSVQPLLDLIEANRVDQRVRSYQTFDDLVGYCRLSAVPIGRLVLGIFDRPEPELAAWSDDVCIALQVLEHCQDVGEDYRRGRIYLPQQDLDRFGVRPEELAGHRAGPELRAVIGHQVSRCERLLDSGGPLVGRLTGWARLAVAGYCAGGRATVAALRAAHCDPLTSVPRPSRARTAWYGLRLFAGGTR